MLKVRVIPTLLWKDFGLVKGKGFDSWRRVGTVEPAMKIYNAREVDELILVDITATAEQREPDYDAIADFSLLCAVPLTVGGGVSQLEHIRRLLQSGADKVSLNSACYNDLDFVRTACEMFGAQCIVASIDVLKEPDGYVCMSHSGKQRTAHQPVDWARQLADCGVGEILLTSVERDGLMEGYDIGLLSQVSAAVDIPVIASGGAGNYQDMVAAVNEGGVSAVAAASIFHFTEQTPTGAKEAMAAAGIPVRRRFSEANA